MAFVLFQPSAIQSTPMFLLWQWGQHNSNVSNVLTCKGCRVWFLVCTSGFWGAFNICTPSSIHGIMVLL